MAAKQIDPNGWYRVKSKTTKHESTVAGMSIRPDEHEILDKDATDGLGNPLPNKPHLDRLQAKEAKAEAEEAQESTHLDESADQSAGSKE